MLLDQPRTYLAMDPWLFNYQLNQIDPNHKFDENADYGPPPKFQPIPEILKRGIYDDYTPYTPDEPSGLMKHLEAAQYDW